jgi:PAS domain S-box-containing protein
MDHADRDATHRAAADATAGETAGRAADDIDAADVQRATRGSSQAESGQGPAQPPHASPPRRQKNELLAGIPSRPAHRWALHYGAAVAAVAAGFALRMAATAWVGPGLPTYVTFYPAVMVVALLAGFGPGLLATVLTVLTAAHWILPPEGLAVDTPVDRLSLVVFAGMGLFMSAVAELYRRSRQKAAAYDREVALRESREALRQSQQRLQLAQASANIGVWDWQPRTGQLFWSPELEGLYGLTQGTIRTYEDWQQRVHPDDLARTEAQRDAAIARREPFDLEFRIRHASGEVRWLASKGKAVYDEAGTVLRVAGVNLDITDRKWAEEALRELNDQLESRVQERTAELRQSRDLVQAERQQFHNVLDQLPAYLVLLSPDYHVPFANRFFEERFGKAQGRRCYEYLFQRTEPCENCETYKVLKSNAPHHWEWTGPDDRNYDIFDFPFTDLDGSPMIMEVGLDVTEQKRAQESLRAASQYARSLIEASLDPLVTISAEGKITDVNEGTIKATGLSREELVGTDFSTYFTEPEKARAGYQQVFAQGYVTDYPLTVRHQDGRVTDVLYNASVYKDAGGNVLGVFAAARDVTERKRAEAAVQRERQRLFDVLETLPVMICLLTPDHHVPFANRSFREKFGESHGRRCYEYCFGRTQPCEFCQNHNVLKTGQPHHWELNWPGNGSVFDVHAFPFTDVDGSPLILDMKLDITERRKVEEELARHREHLEELVAWRTEELARSNKDLEQYAYVASHDLQEPLRAVSGFVALLQQRYQGKLDEEADGYIANAMDGAARMQLLINDLLVYSRVGTRGGGLQTTAVQDSLDQALRNLEASIRDADAVVTSDPLPMVPADALQLTQLFQNLIGNAIKFRSDRRPEVHVGAKRQQDAWLFWVRDNGIGIASEYVERVFLIFQRLHTRLKYPGTGIGLAICRKIVERHGGRIWVESQPNQGATFCFTISDRGEPQ